MSLALPVRLWYGSNFFSNWSRLFFWIVVNWIFLSFWLLSYNIFLVWSTHVVVVGCGCSFFFGIFSSIRNVRDTSRWSLVIPIATLVLQLIILSFSSCLINTWSIYLVVVSRLFIGQCVLYKRFFEERLCRY